MTFIKATMAGEIWKVLVQEGQAVSVGEQISYIGIHENGNFN